MKTGMRTIVSVLFLLSSFFLLEGCASKSLPPGESFHVLTSDKTTLYLTPVEKREFPTVQSYFSSQDVMVTHLRSTGDTSGKYWALYPSVNSGPSPLYTHHIQIEVPANLPVTLEEITSKNIKAVLVSGSGFTGWKLVGVVSTQKDEESFNWFSENSNLLKTE